MTPRSYLCHTRYFPKNQFHKLFYYARQSIAQQFSIFILSLYIFWIAQTALNKIGVQAQNTENEGSQSGGQQFVNFTLTGNLEIFKSTNLIMDYNDQVYMNLQNYFLSLDIMKQSEPVFLCLCTAPNCKEEIPKWDIDKIKQLTSTSKQQNGIQEASNIICNIENYYHTSTEKDLYITFSNQIAELYKANKHLGILVLMKNTVNPTQLILNVQQKRNFCRRCQNALSCESSNCTCTCQAGYFGQYCTESSLIFKLGQGSSDNTSNSSIQQNEEVFVKKIQLSPVQVSKRILQISNQNKDNQNETINKITDSQPLSETTQDPNEVWTNQKSNIQYIQLQIQGVDSSSISINYNKFYFHFKKNQSDKFKIYISDKFQINSAYLSQNDSQSKVEFISELTEMSIYAQTYDVQTQQSSFNNTIVKENQPSSLSYHVNLKYNSSQTLQEYQIMIVNECTSDQISCTNELEISYSLKDFLNVEEKSETSSKIYLIVFLTLTIAGFLILCVYIIYAKIRNAKQLKELAKAKEDKINSELKFQIIRDKVDAEMEDQEKMKNMTGNDIESLNLKQLLKINGNQDFHYNYSENVSSNKILPNQSHQKNAGISNITKVKNHEKNHKFNHQINSDQQQQSGDKYQQNQQRQSQQHLKSDHIFQTSSGENQTKNSVQNSISTSKGKTMKHLYPAIPTYQEQNSYKSKIYKEKQSQYVKYQQNQKEDNSKNNNNSKSSLPSSETKIENAKVSNNVTDYQISNPLRNNQNGQINEINNDSKNNNIEFSLNNISARFNYQQNESNNNVVVLNKESSEQGPPTISKQLSVPSEASNQLPQFQSNNARPFSHYEFKKDDHNTDYLKSENNININNKNKTNEQNQQQSFNYMTTNTSNIQTFNQVMSNQELDNQSPLEDNTQTNIPSLNKIEEKKLFKQLSNTQKSNQSQYKNFNKIGIHTLHQKENTDDTLSEDDISSFKKQGNNLILLNHSPEITAEQVEQHNIPSETAPPSAEDKNTKRRSSSDEFNISQHINRVCNKYSSDMKGIDGSAIMNHRRNILMMGKQNEQKQPVITEETKQDKQASSQTLQSSNDLHSLCLQDIQKIVELQAQLNDQIGQDDDLERGVELTNNQEQTYQEKDDKKQEIDNSFDFICKIKLETPEIFFQNCPKCQSKQHEFQHKMSTYGADAVNASDKYCPECLMKAELSQVKLADSC